jgi:alpha-beta hydrolase superfamily lysophospholipase
MRWMYLIAASLSTLSWAAGAEDLPQTAAAALRLEHGDALPLTAIYTAPVDLRRSHPGDLLRQERFAKYTLSASAYTTRILYHSLDVSGQDVASSAVILVPQGAPPIDGWPVIVWAHGTSGVARQCAPSLMKDVYYDDEGLRDMLRGGFAVIAVDYHGLGTRGPHQYIAKVAQARDVIYSVPAAHAAVPLLGARWVVDGHSQGGLAAWGVAELESSLDDHDYLGAVSVAGAFDTLELMEHFNDAPDGSFYLAYITEGIQAQFPHFKPEEILMPRAMRLYHRVTMEGCWYYGYAQFHGMPSKATLKSNWRENAWVKRYLAENIEADIRINKPLLVVAGEADLTVPINGVRAVVKKTCAGDGALTVRIYPGLDHEPTMTKSVPDQLAWIRARFDGISAENSCSNTPMH